VNGPIGQSGGVESCVAKMHGCCGECSVESGDVKRVECTMMCEVQCTV